MRPRHPIVITGRHRLGARPVRPAGRTGRQSRRSGCGSPNGRLSLPLSSLRRSSRPLWPSQPDCPSGNRPSQPRHPSPRHPRSRHRLGARRAGSAAGTGRQSGRSGCVSPNGRLSLPLSLRRSSRLQWPSQPHRPSENRPSRPRLPSQRPPCPRHHRLGHCRLRHRPSARRACGAGRTGRQSGHSSCVSRNGRLSRPVSSLLRPSPPPWPSQPHRPTEHAPSQQHRPSRRVSSRPRNANQRHRARGPSLPLRPSFPQ